MFLLVAQALVINRLAGLRVSLVECSRFDQGVKDGSE